MEFLKKTNNNFNINEINRISEKFELNKDIVKLLFAREIDNDDKIKNFLSSGITQLNNPFLLKNMQEVVDKIKYYIVSQKNILIMGDYDTDGISASAILYKYFESIGTKCNVFLPNRFVDGYGLTIDTIDKVKKLYNPDLIITVDCGITCVDEIAYCKKIGIDIIVTDHHDIPEIIPDTLIINPKLDDQLYPFKELCGAGVALKVVQALGGLEEALKYTTIASIATVADIVPLKDENRAIVKMGLNSQKDQLPKGIKKLCSKLKIPMPLTSTDISFKMAPKLNATGRMGDAIISFNLYIEKDDEEIDKNIALLLELNDKRVNETNSIYSSACSMLEGVNVSKLGMIVLYDDNWESGVLGIICSKLVEKYNKPVCLLSLVDGEYKGSCRSIPGVNIFEALSNCSDILIRFGGHNQAGGLSLEKKHLNEFRRRINEYVLTNTNEDQLVMKKYYDLDITNTEITEDFVRQLALFEPCGFKNEKPMFKLVVQNNTVSRMSNFPQHIRMKYNNYNLVGFGKGEYYYNLSVNSHKELIIELENTNKFNKDKISGFIKYINYSKLNTATKSEIISANYLGQLNYINCKNDFANHKSMDFNAAINLINDITAKSKFGTAILINNMDTYFKAIKLLKNISNYELFTLNNAMCENVIVFSPDKDISLKDYSNIFLLDSYLCDGYVAYLLSNNSNVYTTNEKLNLDHFTNLQPNRDSFGKILNALKSVKEKHFPDLITLFNTIRRNSIVDKNIKYNQFMFFMLVMEELSILKFENGELEIFNNKSLLDNSSIYKFVVQLIGLK